MYRLQKLAINRAFTLRNKICCSNRSFLAGLNRPRSTSSKVVVPAKDLQFQLHHLKPSYMPKPINLFCLQRANSTKSMGSVDEAFRHLDYNQLIESKNKENNIVIDVREKTELQETGTIPGSFHIPLGDVETALRTPEDEFKQKYNFEKPSAEDTVIFSCRSGKRSLVALEKALASGFKNAKHYKGGWLDWEKNLSDSKK